MLHLSIFKRCRWQKKYFSNIWQISPDLGSSGISKTYASWPIKCFKQVSDACSMLQWSRWRHCWRWWQTQFLWRNWIMELQLFSSPNDDEKKKKKKQVQCSCRCCQTCDNSTVNVSLLCSCLLCKFKLNELRHFLTSFGHQKITSSLRQKIRVAWKNAATGIKWLSKSRISSRTAMNYTYRGLKSLIFFK